MHFFFAGEQLREGEALTVGGIYYRMSGDGVEHLFKRGLTPIQALERATGSTAVCVRLSNEGATFAQSLQVLSIVPAQELLFEFACRCVELVFNKQAQFGSYRPSPESVQALSVRRLWLAGLLGDTALAHSHACALSVPCAYNRGRPGTPWWSYYDAEAQSMQMLAECAASLVASSFTSNANFRSEVLTAEEKLVYRVACLSVQAACANSKTLAWKCRAQGLDCAGFVENAIANGVYAQETRLAQEAAEAFTAAQNRMLLELLNSTFHRSFS